MCAHFSLFLAFYFRTPGTPVNVQNKWPNRFLLKADHFLRCWPFKEMPKQIVAFSNACKVVFYAEMNSRSKYSKALNLIKSNRVISKLFDSETHHRTITTRSNVIFSSLYKGISILLSLWLVPLTLDYLNPTKYGIWLTLTSIIAWFGF